MTRPLAGNPSWRALLGYVWPQRRWLVLGGLLSLATTATGLALPLVVRELISSFTGDRSIRPLLMAMMLLVLANAGIGALGSYVLRRAAESVVLSARKHLVRRLLRLRLSAVEQSEPGDLMSRVTSDTTLLSEVATESLVGGVTGAAALAATVVMMAVLDPVLVSVTIAALATAVAVIGFVVPRIQRAARRAQESVGEMGAALERVFGAFRTVKASNAETREQVRVDAAARQTWRANIASAVWSAVAGNTAGLAMQLAFIAVLTVGGARVASGALSVGTLVAFLLYIYYLMPAVQAVAGAVTQYQYGAAAIRRIQEVDALPTEPTNNQPTPSRDIASTGPDRAAAGIGFQAVSFRYSPDLPWSSTTFHSTFPPSG